MSIQAVILILAPLGLQLFGMSFAVLTDRYLQKKHRRDLLIIAALLLCLVAQNLLETRLMQGDHVFARTLTAIAGYSIRPLILLLFLRIVSPQNSHWLVHLTALFSPICFTITADNSFCRGPLGYTCHGISMLLLLNLMSLTIREYRHDRKQGLWIPLLNALLVVAAMAADTLLTVSLPISFLTVTMVSCCVFYYVWLHQQFVRRHERDLMAEQRIQIMMTQIQPHFLYNTLSTIQALCAIDPAKAVEITGKFSSYLRQNLNTLEFPGLISFEKELEHTRSYADIEMVRFPNIRVVLSGMSSLEQMKDNVSFMEDFKPLDEHEQEVIREAQKALDADQSIPCTACRYCTKGCPMNIPIPEIFTVANRRKGSPEFRTIREYGIVTQGKGKASDCIQCGQCEAACPQHLPIIESLQKAWAELN